MTDRARYLIARHMEATLTPDERDEFNAVLAADPAARSALVEATLHARLIATRLSDADSLAAPSPNPGVPRPSGAWRIAAISASIAAALLVAAAIVALVLPTLIERPDAEAAREPIPVATLIDATGDVMIEDNLSVPGQDYAAAPYSIETGEAEFLMSSGATVRLIGPARLVVHSAMHASLDRGTATFHCPPGAVGYTVDLPHNARVVDLGTRFALDVDPAGPIRLRVTEGAVHFEPGNGGEPVVIDRARRVRVAPDGSVIVFNDSPIEIVNPSFELDETGARIPADKRYVGADRILGWHAPRGDVVGQARRSDFVDGAPDNFLTDAIDGERTAQVNAAGRLAAPPYAAQVLPEPLAPGAEYTLTVAVARRLDHDRLGMVAAGWAIGLFDADSGQPLDPERSVLTGSLRVGDGGAAVDRSLSYTATASDADRRIEVRLINLATGDTFNAVNFDNVRLYVGRPIIPHPDAARKADAYSTDD